MRPWLAVLASAFLFGSAIDSLAQNLDAIIKHLPPAARSGIIKLAEAEWKKLSQIELDCVNQKAHSRGGSVQSFIQRGILPVDPRIVDIVPQCKTAGAQISQRQSPPPILYNRTVRSLQQALVDCAFWARAQFENIRPEQAIPACEAVVASQPNNPEALLALGKSYQRANNMAGAVAQYRKAADLNYPMAKALLGLLYETGFGVPKDIPLAMKLYRVALEQRDTKAVALVSGAANKGHAVAQYSLASMYEQSQGSIPSQISMNDAVTWYRKAADQGFAPAQSKLGVLYENGLGLSKDFVQAIEWYRKAAAQGNNDAIGRIRKTAEEGNALAQVNLGLMYESGQGVSKDFTQALRWYFRAAEQENTEAIALIIKAAEQGNADAMGWISNAADHGSVAAITWFNKAAEQGNGNALAWLQQSAEAGHSDAQFYLGGMYENGRGVPKDLDQALRWNRKAAEQGHVGATKWIIQAADQGNTDALTAVIQFADKGSQDDVSWLTKNAKRGNQVAVEWLTKSATEGKAVSQFELASMYETGRGVPKDLAKAVAWYGKAAERGHAESQYVLGMMYEDGRNVQRDQAKAKEWIGKSADQGNNQAIAWMKRVAAIEEAQRKAAELVKKGLDYASKRETAWRLMSKKNEMIDVVENLAVSWQENERGAGAEIVGKCVNKDILFTATVLDKYGKPTVELPWITRMPTTAELTWQQTMFGGYDFNPIVTLPITIRFNDNPPVLRVRKHDEKFKNVVPLLLLRHQHWRLAGTEGGSTRDNEANEFVKLLVGIEDDVIAGIWRIMVQFDTSAGPLLIKIPIFDNSIQQMIKSCS
jgi:TPR repeat protein